MAQTMVDTNRAEELFTEFRSNPSSETLIALLRGNQDRIYNVCYQVLRHPQDAEDASQDVLLELVEWCARIREPRAFRTWLFRVAMNTALTHKKARLARAARDRRSVAMPTPEDRSEVVDAIARLDDESRSLILEHYFEKTTLEELARKEGLSVAGLWKRLERAKGRLRQALLGAGVAITPAGLVHSLEMVAPVSAPANLVGAAVASKAALVISGGIAVASKTAISGAAIVLALAMFTVGAGGGFVAGRSRPTPPPENRPPVAVIETPAPERPAVRFVPETAPAPETATLPEKSAPPPEDKQANLPPHLKFGWATRFGPWKEFYDHANALGLSFREMRSLVFEKLERELKLTDEEKKVMHDLVREEEDAVTKIVYGKYGSGDALMKMMNVSGSQKSALMDDIESMRDSVRITYNPRYASAFPPDRVKAINDRLRGTNVIFCFESDKGHSIRSLPGFMD